MPALGLFTKAVFPEDHVYDRTAKLWAVFMRCPESSSGGAP